MTTPTVLRFCSSVFFFGMPLFVAMGPVPAVAQRLEGEPQEKVRALASAVTYLLEQDQIRGPLRFGLAKGQRGRADAERIAQILETTSSVASRLGAHFDPTDTFLDSVCDEIGKSEVGGDGCRWVTPGNPIEVLILPAVKGEPGLRIGVEVWAVGASLRSTTHGTLKFGSARHYSLRAVPDGGRGYKFEILDVFSMQLVERVGGPDGFRR